MISWPFPEVRSVDGTGHAVRLYDTADQTIKKLSVSEDKDGTTAGMYVCGITPYDATHLGHAATYLVFDVLNRVLRDRGLDVNYVQNITDVDDPLFERAEQDGRDWRDIAREQIELFRTDMQWLNVIPPNSFISVTESIDEVIDVVQRLLDQDKAYVIDGEYPDIYAPISATEHFGYESNYSREEMMDVFGERGGDPQRPGKRDPMDALIWKSARPGEPSWPAPFGQGRPGWHIECAAIASQRLGAEFDIQGGGSDLAFPHHEFSAAHIEAAYNVKRMASHYVHAGMIGLNGTKMSKSLGNLEFIHTLRNGDADASVIRIALFSQHYRADRDWSSQLYKDSAARLQRWREALDKPGDMEHARAAVEQTRSHLANDLDTPNALAVIDDWVSSERGADDTNAGVLMAAALDGLLGVRVENN